MWRCYKFKIYPSVEQAELLNKMFGCKRWIYNRFLDNRNNAHKNGETIPTHESERTELTTLLKGMRWLNIADRSTLYDALERVDRTYNAFLKTVKNKRYIRYPSFLRKNDPWQSYSCKDTQGKIKILGSALIMPKVGPIARKATREIGSKIVFASIAKTPEDEFLACVVYNTDSPISDRAKDAGTGKLTENGKEKSDDPKVLQLQKSEQRLRRLKRQLNRKINGSKNKEKARQRVRNLERRIENQKRNMVQVVKKNHKSR
ncbi:MAG: helix-turn-helix domain-containing protein [Christensenellaceae bacterium]|jgi:putative transposase|nr:helix-turn-helix domain-containing protein [Christensenellaceae bacterium]